MDNLSQGYSITLQNMIAMMLGLIKLCPKFDIAPPFSKVGAQVGI